MLEAERFRRFAPLLLLLAAAIWWACLIRWNGPLTESHDFRQSQTALSAYWMLRDGISLLRPPLPLLGIEHTAVPMEFPLYQAITALVAPGLAHHRVQAILEAERLLNFAGFLLAAWALYRLVRYLHDDHLALCTLVLFLLLPFPVAWAFPGKSALELPAAALA